MLGGYCCVYCGLRYGVGVGYAAVCSKRGGWERVGCGICGGWFICCVGIGYDAGAVCCGAYGGASVALRVRTSSLGV